MKERKFKPCLIKQLLHMFKLRCEWGFRFAQSRVCIWLPTSYCCVPSVVAFIKETLGLRACHYVFMFEYPTGLKKTIFVLAAVYFANS